jgi:uncharacterized membrane protein YdjX (TVP38/TMEM64 family)
MEVDPKQAPPRTPASRLGRAASIALRSRFVWIVVALVAVSLALDHWVDGRGGAKEVVQSWGIWAPLVAFVVQTLTTMTPIGAVFIAVVNGMIFPLWLAITINIASGVIGGIGMYFVWRRGDHEFDIDRHIAKLPPWFHSIAGPNLLSLTLLRLVPWAGGGLADLIAGARRVPLWVQILSLILGYAPGSVLYALMGAGLIAMT